MSTDHKQIEQTIASVESAVLLCQIAEYFLDDGFTVLGEYAYYRSWCHGRDLDPADVKSVLAHMRILHRSPYRLLIDNSKSQSLKPIFAKLERHLKCIAFMSCGNKPLTNYDVMCADVWFELRFIKSMKKYNQEMIFDIEALQYSRRRGFTLSRDVGQTLVEITNCIQNNQKLHYVCKLSGDSNKKYIRQHAVEVTHQMLLAKWTIDGFDDHFEQTYYGDYACCNKAIQKNKGYLLTNDKDIFVRDKILCLDCLMKYLRYSADTSSYIQMISSKKLILPCRT